MTQLQKDAYRETLLSMPTEELHKLYRKCNSRDQQDLISAELHKRPRVVID